VSHAGRVKAAVAAGLWNIGHYLCDFMALRP
jgi:hypothetical protein